MHQNDVYKCTNTRLYIYPFDEIDCFINCTYGIMYMQHTLKYFEECLQNSSFSLKRESHKERRRNISIQPLLHHTHQTGIRIHTADCLNLFVADGC